MRGWHLVGQAGLDKEDYYNWGLFHRWDIRRNQRTPKNNARLRERKKKQTNCLDRKRSKQDHWKDENDIFLVRRKGHQ